MSEGPLTIADAEKRYVLRVPVECYSRVVGYLRPVDAWNEGKRQEFKERVTYKLPKDGASEKQGNIRDGTV